MTFLSMQKKNIIENLPVSFVHHHSSRVQKVFTNMFLIITRMKKFQMNRRDGKLFFLFENTGLRNIMKFLSNFCSTEIKVHWKCTFCNDGNYHQLRDLIEHWKVHDSGHVFICPFKEENGCDFKTNTYNKMHYHVVGKDSDSCPISNAM